MFTTPVARPTGPFLALIAAATVLSSACTESTQPTDREVVQPTLPAVVQPAPAAPAPLDTDFIYVASANGSTLARLTQGDWPAWSPDGKRIAFHRSGRIHVISADGADDVPLTAGSWPAWSPDGTEIVFNDTSGISVMNADGTANRNLIRHDFRPDTYKPWDMGVGKPAWSPDGKRIAFEHLGDGDMVPAQVFVMNADGSSPRLLTTLPPRTAYAESDPSWSPGGSKIAYWSYWYGIAAVDVNDGVAHTVYIDFSTFAYGAKPVWSPDGRTLVFNSFQGLAAGPSIFSVASTGGKPTVLIPNAYHAAWSPDGSRIAFVSTRAR